MLRIPTGQVKHDQFIGTALVVALYKRQRILLDDPLMPQSVYGFTLMQIDTGDKFFHNLLIAHYKLPFVLNTSLMRGSKETA